MIGEKRGVKMSVFCQRKNILKEKINFLLHILSQNSLILHIKQISSLAHLELPQTWFKSAASKNFAARKFKLPTVD